MSLTWRDTVATVLAAVAGAVAYFELKGFNVPALANWRAGSVALLLLGFGGCIVAGSGAIPAKDTWFIGSTIIGAAGFVLAVIGMAANSKTAFLLLLADIVVLWLLATTHHILAKT